MRPASNSATSATLSAGPSASDCRGWRPTRSPTPREQITGLYRRAWAHSDATISELALGSVGHVPWWPDDRSEVTLHKILVHMIAETDRHAGQADIVRELIDGATGLRGSNDSMAPGDQAWWEGYRSRLERAAKEAGRTAAREAG
jgi:hypothetical protein